jgi:hypothetical protein
MCTYMNVNVYEDAIDMLAVDCQVGRQVCVFSDSNTSQWNVAL